MVIYQYALNYFVSRRHIFVILQNFSSLFSHNQLVRFTCTVQVITLRDIGGSVAEWVYHLTFSCFEFWLGGFDTPMWHCLFLFFIGFP